MAIKKLSLSSETLEMLEHYCKVKDVKPEAVIEGLLMGYLDHCALFKPTPSNIGVKN